MRRKVGGGVRGLASVDKPHPLCISQGCNLLLSSLSLKLEAVGVSSLQPEGLVQNTDSSVLEFNLIHLHTDRQTEGQTDRKTDRQRDRHKDRQEDRQVGQTGRRTERVGNRCVSRDRVKQRSMLSQTGKGRS